MYPTTHFPLVFLALFATGQTVQGTVTECYTHIKSPVEIGATTRWPVTLNGPIQKCMNGTNFACIKEIFEEDGMPTQYKGGCSGNPSQHLSCFSMIDNNYKRQTDGSFAEVNGKYSFCLCDKDRCNGGSAPMAHWLGTMLLSFVVANVVFQV
mmetsp:Transcript_12680/g.29184  ORF Transcript_12680/g.29184 Transcript_12680/m.29184 type:complete len:152 (-) Transcript_12680:141-596(-)